MKTRTLSRNWNHRSLWRCGLLLIPLLLSCFALIPIAQAVGPDTEGAISGSNNGEGIGVLVSRTTGVWNTGTGFEALNHLTAGNQNTATGLRALFSDISGGYNTATGVYSLFSNTSGFLNSATGAYALTSNTIGSNNTANGYGALLNNRTGSNNTAVGLSALPQNSTGSGNTALGLGAGQLVTAANNVICIGSPGANVSNSCFIGNIFGVTSSGGTGVFVNSAGKLGTSTSSRRFKDHIEPMDRASEALFALKPVAFRYKKEIDPQGIPQFGLVAEDVEKVNPDLVVRDAQGKVNSVRYEAVNAMLLNEFLKEHRKVEELKSDFQAAIAQQQKEIQALTAQLKEQAAQIQKVSAQFEMSRPAARTVLSNR